jgi:uncharacterized caspase-like protein
LLPIAAFEWRASRSKVLRKRVVRHSRPASWLRQFALLVVLLLAPSLVLTIGAATAAEKRLALVVGNARYPTLPLNNPENDARVVASTLRRLGFEVTEHVNLNVKDFRRVLREFARRLQNEEGASVFYYAGHGVQIDGRNYLLPVDINLRDEEEVKDESVDVDELYVSRLERARTQVRIVILDACRDNPFASISGGKTRNIRAVGGLAEMAARGALIAYASAPGAVAEDGPPGTNSVYTRNLVKEMLAEGVEVEQMFKAVRVKVLRDTNERQVPWVNTSLTASFSFNPKKGPSPEEAAKQEAVLRLQALLDKREKEQRQLEEQIKRLSRKLELVESGGPTAAARPSIAAAQPAPAQTPLLPPAVTAPSSASPAVASSAAASPSLPAAARPPSAASAREIPIRPSAAKIEAMMLAALKPAATQDAAAPKPAVSTAASAAPDAAASPPAAATAPATAPATVDPEPASSKPEAATPVSAAAAESVPARVDPSAETAPKTAAKTPAAPTQILKAESEPAARPAKKAEPSPAVALAQPKTKPKTAVEKPQPAPSKARLSSERCVALLIQAQLGEQLAPADMAYLQKECR